MLRRTFLKLFGGLVAGTALEDAIPKGTLYFFPKEIKIAKSLGESEYFVKVDTLVDKYIRPVMSGIAEEIDRAVICRQIYDPVEYYAGKRVPIKTEYLPAAKADKFALDKLKGNIERTASSEVVHNPDGSKWTFDRPNEEFMHREYKYVRRIVTPEEAAKLVREQSIPNILLKPEKYTTYSDSGLILVES